MNYEFEEDKYIIEALRMFGPLTPPQISTKLTMREDIANRVKSEITDKFYIQNRCLMMIRSKHIQEADIEYEPDDGFGRWRYYRI
jgi:hypothetical protein